MKEVEVAQARIKELIPEATIPKDLRPEYDELKEEIKRLGGTKKIREMLNAGEGTNRQAFAQNKRIMVTTPSRILTDPLFRKVPYDLLIVDDAPRIPTPLLLAASGLIRERIILSGNTNDLLLGESASAIRWPHALLETLLSSPASTRQRGIIHANRELGVRLELNLQLSSSKIGLFREFNSSLTPNTNLTAFR